MGVLVGNPVRGQAATGGGDRRRRPGAGRGRGRCSAAVKDHRLGAAVALLFLQGWRISEVLGLAWDDLDLDAGTAHVRRASVYVDGRGQQLGPPKTDGARGEHWLMPTVVTLLRRQQAIQAQERAAAPRWQTR